MHGELPNLADVLQDGARMEAPIESRLPIGGARGWWAEDEVGRRGEEMVSGEVRAPIPRRLVLVPFFVGEQQLWVRTARCWNRWPIIIPHNNKNAINTGSGDVCGASVVAVHGWGNTYIEFRNKNNPSGYSFDPNATKDQIEIITCVKKGELLFSKIELD